MYCLLNQILMILSLMQIFPLIHGLYLNSAQLVFMMPCQWFALLWCICPGCTPHSLWLENIEAINNSLAAKNNTHNSCTLMSSRMAAMKLRVGLRGFLIWLFLMPCSVSGKTKILELVIAKYFFPRVLWKSNFSLKPTIISTPQVWREKAVHLPAEWQWCTEHRVPKAARSARETFPFPFIKSDLILFSPYIWTESQSKSFVSYTRWLHFLIYIEREHLGFNHWEMMKVSCLKHILNQVCS